MCFLSVCILQHCKIYLCGTKNDLIEADRSLRQIDYHDAQDFAEGDYNLTVINLPLILVFWPDLPDLSNCRYADRNACESNICVV